MALSDLLWACPGCGTVGGIDAEGRCTCGVTYDRTRGSLIRARRPSGESETLTPAEWVARLPDPATLLDHREGEGEGEGEGDREGKADHRVIRRATALAREVVGSRVVRGRRGRYLNRIERFGDDLRVVVELTRNGVYYSVEGGRARSLSFERLTAIQASSSTLQIKARDQPLVSLRFLDDSIFLWELLITEALRAYYRTTGRGEIVEFQPRIVTR